MKVFLFVPESVPLLSCKVPKLFTIILAYFRLEMVGKFTFLPLCKKTRKEHTKNKLILMQHSQQITNYSCFQGRVISISVRNGIINTNQKMCGMRGISTTGHFPIIPLLYLMFHSIVLLVLLCFYFYFFCFCFFSFQKNGT